MKLPSTDDKKITRKDIAEMAGVSVSVVSRALNNSGYVEQRKKQNQDCNRGCFNAGQAGKPAADSRATGMNHGYSGGIKLWVNISEQTVFAERQMLY